MKRLLAGLALAAACIAPAGANESMGPLIGPNGANLELHVNSPRERGFENVVREEADASCGAAVLATIVGELYGVSIGEANVLKGMLHVANPALVRKRGFSLSDIQNYAHVLGLSARSFAAPLATLRTLRVPAIVPLNTGGYHHFALLRKVDESFAYLADPALGNRVERLDRFASMWNGVVLLVARPADLPDDVPRGASPPLGADERYA
jgi:predicted double-glycine peptidase